MEASGSAYNASGPPSLFLFRLRGQSHQLAVVGLAPLSFTPRPELLSRDVLTASLTLKEWMSSSRRAQWPVASRFEAHSRQQVSIARVGGDVVKPGIGFKPN